MEYSGEFSSINTSAILGATSTGLIIYYLLNSTNITRILKKSFNITPPIQSQNFDGRKSFLINFFCLLISAFIVYRFMDLTNSISIVGGIMVAFWGSVGFFISLTLLGSEIKRGNIYNTIYVLLTKTLVLVLMGAILGFLAK